MTTPKEAPSAPATEGDGLPGEGQIIAGKYRVASVLGRGGMGVVVAAEHVTLRQKVAVKFLLPQAMTRPDATERFLREARSAVAIQSEHVARVIDVGTLSSGAPFMVMEYLTGTDLGHVLESRGVLPVEQAVDYVLQACEAIAEAHALGVIHRDLKPANLFLTTRADGAELVKVLDFGLSKAIRPDAPGALELSLTATNTMLGSPHYMSPEQIRNLKTIDSRTDIWALGVILYQLLTARRPFEDESLGGLFIMIGADPPTPIRNWRHELPVELADVIMRCLEKEPSARPQSVAELARGLAPFGSAESRVSVERITRVLSDRAPLPPPRGSQPSYPEDMPGSPPRQPSGPGFVVHPSQPPPPPGGPRISSRPGPLSVSAPARSARGGVDATTAGMASTLAEGEAGSRDRPSTQRTLARSARGAVALMVGVAVAVIILGMVMFLVFQPGATVGQTALRTPPLAPADTAPTAAPEGASAAPRTELTAPLPSTAELTALVSSASASASAPAAPPPSATPKAAPPKATTGGAR